MPIRNIRRTALCLSIGTAFTLAPSITGQSTHDDQAQGKAWWAHVQYLASNDMQGRQTGSAEYLKAAEYVVDKFKSYGLEPAGVSGGWYQPVKFDVQRVVAEKSSVTLLTPCQTCFHENSAPVRLGDELVLGTRQPQPKRVQGQMIFIGYGLHLPEAKYDDFDWKKKGAESLAGKILVYMNGGPAELPTALKSYARTSPFLKAAREAGAVGLISIPTPKSMDFGWQRVASSASQPGMRLSATPDGEEIAKRHPALADDHDPIFTATFNPAQAERLFSDSGHTFAEMLALADAQKPLPRFALNKAIAATVVTETTQVESPNIAARLDGSDPALKAQYVLVSAHLDHVGVGAEIHGKTIYAGAMDDASGVATVLETARRFSEAAKSGQRPKRSILFLIFTAEEKGLLGSRYYAGHPTIPEKAIVADLNLDMFMPIFPLKKLHVQGLEQSTLQDDAKAVGAAHGIEIAGDPEPDRNSFIRTDQYSFVQAGVPALAMKFGWTAGSPEYKAWRAWLAERYHSTDDDLTQPVDLAAAAQFNRFFADLARHVADDPSRPHYLPSSFFHRFEAAE